MTTLSISETTSKTIKPSDNHILAALPAEVFDRLRPNLKPVTLPLGKVIFESGVKLDHVYFPVPGCIISMLYVLEDGSSAEIAVVGNEGIVQSTGYAFKLSGAALKKEFERHSELQHLLLRYTQALITQMTQTAVCNRHHSLDQQLCRWLLLSLDRLSSNEISMTQELIANMLGVRREGVTEAAGKLQDKGLISYRRGHIKVLDRPGLEAMVCECYAVVQKEYARLLPAKKLETRTISTIID